MDPYRVWAEIDLDALAHNLGVIRRRVGTNVAVMLVVKADAYGHGAVAIAHHALRHGVAALGVGTSAEALELRKAGVRARILVLGTIVDEEASAALRHDVEIGLHSADRCKSLEDLAARLGVRARVHLKVDTGLARLGVMPSKALELLEHIHGSPHLQLAGVMTHMASSEGWHDERTREQTRAFEQVLWEARLRGLLRGWIHAANSACIFTGMERMYDCVRPGISAYGVLPGTLPGADELQAVMSLRTQIVFMKDVPAGSPVGYGGTWQSTRPTTRIATLPVGYNDGLAWRLGNTGEVLVRGQRARIVGRISMDYSCVDVSDIPGVSVGDRVTLVGTQGEERITLERVAEQIGTIPYEVSCSVGKRVERVYVGGEGLLHPQPRNPQQQASPEAHSATTTPTLPLSTS